MDDTQSWSRNQAARVNVPLLGSRESAGHHFRAFLDVGGTKRKHSSAVLGAARPRPQRSSAASHWYPLRYVRLRIERFVELIWTKSKLK